MFLLFDFEPELTYKVRDFCDYSQRYDYIFTSNWCKLFFCFGCFYIHRFVPHFCRTFAQIFVKKKRMCTHTRASILKTYCKSTGRVSRPSVLQFERLI